MRKRHPGQASSNGMGGQGGQGSNNRRPSYQKYGKPQSNDRYGQQPRARKNYSALREKYLNHAKDALSSGDRVLAEYYLQHADHYYRMMVEFQESRPVRSEQSQNNETGEAENYQQQEAENVSAEDVEPDVDIPNNSNVLPAFLTRKVPASKTLQEAPPEQVQEWEEEQ